MQYIFLILLMFVNPAWSDEMYLTAERDVKIMKTHGDNNNGLYERLRVKTANGIVRSLIGFDITSLKGKSIKRVQLKLFLIEGNFGKDGLAVSLHRIRAPWIEGCASFDRFFKRSGFDCQDVGVTWRCPIDRDLGTSRVGCSEEERWNGGDFDDTPSAISIHTEGEQSVYWDLTEDIKTALSDSVYHPSWVIKKFVEKEKGGAVYYSREIANHPNSEDLFPRLIIELE